MAPPSTIHSGASRAPPSLPHILSCHFSPTLKKLYLPSRNLVSSLGGESGGWGVGSMKVKTGKFQVNLNSLFKATENVPMISLPVLTKMSLSLYSVGIVSTQQVTLFSWRWSEVLSGSYICLELINKPENKTITT